MYFVMDVVGTYDALHISTTGIDFHIYAPMDDNIVEDKVKEPI